MECLLNKYLVDLFGIQILKNLFFFLCNLKERIVVCAWCFTSNAGRFRAFLIDEVGRRVASSGRVGTNLEGCKSRIHADWGKAQEGKEEWGEN